MGRVFALGLSSALLYFLVFIFEEWINHYFRLGGFYAALPVLTAFVFSIVHGAFASSIWSLFNVNPKRTK